MKKQRLLFLSVIVFLFGMGYAAEHTVPSGGDIQATIDAAADGDVIILESGGYYEGGLLITKSLTLKAADGYTQRPTITVESTNTLTFGEDHSGAEVIIKGIEFSSKGSDYLARLESNDSLAYLEMTDVVGHGYSRCIIRASNPTCYLDSTLIDNCYFYDLLGSDYRLFYIDTDCPVKYFKVVNSTFVDFNRTFLQLTAAGKKTVIVDQCNIHGRSDIRDDDLFDIDGDAGSSFSLSNSIITSIKQVKIWDIKANVTDSIMNVFYYDIQDLTKMTGNTWSYEAAFTETDPMFTNGPVGALYLDPASAALTASTTGGPIGDPRWAVAPHVASLLRLTLDEGMISPGFDPATLDYTAVAPFGTTSDTVRVVTNYANATVTGDGGVDLTSGSGSASVVVTGSDGTTTQTYTVAITVALPSEVATLSSLMVFSQTDTFDLTPAFDPATETYTLEVPAETDFVFVEAETTDDNATMVVSDTVDVQSGSGVATVVVTAENGTTIKTYTVNITVAAIGIELNDARKINFYYNSAIDQLKIFNSSEVELVEIYSLTGQLIRSEKVYKQENLEFNTGMLPAGMYLVRMKLSGNGMETGKFVK